MIKNFPQSADDRLAWLDELSVMDDYLWSLAKGIPNFFFYGGGS